MLSGNIQNSKQIVGSAGLFMSVTHVSGTSSWQSQRVLHLPQMAHPCARQCALIVLEFTRSEGPMRAETSGGPYLQTPGSLSWRERYAAVVLTHGTAVAGPVCGESTKLLCGVAGKQSPNDCDSLTPDLKSLCLVYSYERTFSERPLRLVELWSQSRKLTCRRSTGRTRVLSERDTWEKAGS